MGGGFLAGFGQRETPLGIQGFPNAGKLLLKTQNQAGSGMFPVQSVAGHLGVQVHPARAAGRGLGSPWGSLGSPGGAALQVWDVQPGWERNLTPKRRHGMFCECV